MSKGFKELIAMSSGRAAQAILSFVAVSIVARLLGPESLGVYSVILAVFYYCMHVSEFGLRSIAIREWHNKMKKGVTNIGSYFFIRVTLALFVSISSYVVSKVYFTDYAIVILIIMLSTLFMAIQIDWVLLVTERYLASSWVLVIRPAVYCISIYIFYLNNSLTLITLATSFLISWVLLAAGTWLINRESLLVGIKKISIEDVKELSFNGLPIFLIALIGQAIQSIDLLYIGAHYGAKQAGFYYLCSAIVVAGTIFANSMSQISLSKMSKHLENKTQFNNVLFDDFKLLIVIATVLSLLLYIVVSPLIPIIFGEEYVPSSSLILYFIPYFFMYHVNALLSSCYIVINRQKELLILNVVRIALLLIGILIITTNEKSIHLVALLKGGIEILLCIYILTFRTKSIFGGLFKLIKVPIIIIVFYSAYLLIFEQTKLLAMVGLY